MKASLVLLLTEITQEKSHSRHLTFFNEIFKLVQTTAAQSYLCIVWALQQASKQHFSSPLQ